MKNRSLRVRAFTALAWAVIVTAVAGTAAADTISLAWDPNPELTVVGYMVHVGTQSGAYTQHLDVGLSTAYGWSAAVAGQRYCFAVSAYNSSHLEGPTSSEVCGYSNTSPTLVNPGSRSSAVGQPTSLQLQGSDPDGLPVSYGAMGLPPGMSLMVGTGYISGTPTTVGNYTVTATVYDGVLNSSQTFAWSVTATGGAPPPPTSGWTFCAREGDTCSFSGTQQVRYGANGLYATRTLSGGTACTNAVFGDPAPGMAKQCDTAATSTSTTGSWGLCANEGGTCAFTGTQEVRYGANGLYAYRTLSGGTPCTNSVFGDPAPGMAKHCDTTGTSTSTSGWNLCAYEGGTCAFSGTQQVRYGGNGVYAYRTLTDGTPCSNSVFGDPAPGVAKQCDTSTSTATISWNLCANEGGTCAFSGTQQVRYGANGLYAYRTLTDGTPCTNSVFGDPAPGLTKQCHTSSSSTPPPVPPTGPTGLRGDYYSGVSFGTFVTSRTDPSVNFSWSGSPATDVPADNFSVRWTGAIVAPVTGMYTFSTVSDDGVWLWVGNQLLINNWTDHPATTNTSVGVWLQGGQTYPLKLEYYDRSDGAVIQLQWTYPGQGMQVIPQSALTPP
jgi:hypothetical protein